MKRKLFAAYEGLPRTVWFLFAARLVTSMGSFIVPLLTLILTQKLGMSAAQAGGWMSALVLTQAPCLMLGGKLTDAVGRRPVLVFGYFAGAACFLLCAFHAGNGWVVPCIVLAANFGTLGYPSGDALLADQVGPAQRRAAYSLLYFGTNIGMTFSMILGGLLFAEHLRLLFVLDAATTILCGCIVLAFVPDRYRPARKSAAGAAPEAGGQPSAAGETALASEKSAPLPDAAAPTLGAVLRAVPVVAGAVGLLFFYDFCYAQWNFLLPAQMGALYGAAGARRFSLLGAINCVTVILLTPALTKYTHRIPPLPALALGAALYGAAFLGFAAGGGMPLFVVYGVLFTLGEVVTTIQWGAFLADRTPAACRGRMTAFSSFVRGAGTGCAPAAMGFALTVLGYRGGWLVTAALVLCAGAGMLLLSRRDRGPVA